MRERSVYMWLDHGTCGMGINVSVRVCTQSIQPYVVQEGLGGGYDSKDLLQVPTSYLCGIAQVIATNYSVSKSYLKLRKT